MGDFFRDAIKRALTVLDKENVWLTIEDVINADRPRDCGVEVNNICNARCSFCGYGKTSNSGLQSDIRAKDHLSEELLKHTLDLFSRAGGGSFSIGPILGENTVHPKWVEFIKIAKSYKNIKSISCFSNGILLDRFGYDEICKSGLTNLTISTCLGSSDRYPEIYGVNAYDRVSSNILNLLEANKKHGEPICISIALRIDKPYSNFFDSVICKQILKFIPVERISILSEGWDDFRGIVGKDGLPKGHEFRGVTSAKYEPCYALYRKIQVLLDGTIQACSCRIEPELWTENIRDFNSLHDAYRNETLETLRNNWLNGIVPVCCSECTHYAPASSLIMSRKKPVKKLLNLF